MEKERHGQKLEQLIEQLFKSESAKLLSVLTRIFGTQNFTMAQDVLQDTFAKALSRWQQDGIPDNPAAWMTTCAKNGALDVIRKNKTTLTFAADLSHFLESEWSLSRTLDDEFSDAKIKDDQLRMIFACCHLQLTADNAIPFILQTLCGFSLKAIARALVQPEAVIKKRLYRTKVALQQQPFDFPEPQALASVLDEVHRVLYLLFNEGFHSSGKTPLDLMFCLEAVGLTKLVLEQSEVANKETHGLLALMYFHMGRADSRVDSEGYNVPIDLQDRTLWSAEYLAEGKARIEQAKQCANGRAGRFFLEALIAQQHCAVTAFELTNWLMIVELYRHLVHITQSPVAQLNLAIAIAYSGEVSRAIAEVEQLINHKSLQKSHMPLAILAHLNAMAGRADLAHEQACQSMLLGGTAHEHRLLLQQIKRQLAHTTSA